MQEKKKILVVDDEPDVVEMIRAALESASYQVVVAYDGEEAVERTRTERPDAIIMDLMMPGMDGFAASEELKNASETSRIPILTLTAYPKKGPREGYGRDLGFQLITDDFIQKPVDPAKLISRLGDAMSR